MQSRNLLVVAIAGAVLTGCSSMSSTKGPDYRSQGGKIPSLEVPPDLTSPVADDRFVIPDPKATTYSSYNRDRSGVPVTASTTVLPKVDSARVERAGDQRWLVVKAPPERVWNITKEFWAESGFVLRRELPEAGIMETDWAEDRARIQQDFIRGTIGKMVDGMYESGRRDKFRTRLEPGSEPGTVEVYVSHRGVEEIYGNPDKIGTVWQPRPVDRELEAEMLARLMLKFGYTAPEKAAASPAAAPATAARAAYDRAKGGPLVVNEPFDRAWRRVGLALDRTGFTVEDRDRSKGLFFVRYIDPEADAKSGGGGQEKSFMDKLAFWRKDDPAAKAAQPAPKPEPAPSTEKSFMDKLAFWRKDEPMKPLYRIYVSEAGGISTVEVQTSDGKMDNSNTAKRILGLLQDQLK